jgi:hypothetical protein
VQGLGAGDPLVPPLLQVGLVPAGLAWPGGVLTSSSSAVAPTANPVLSAAAEAQNAGGVPFKVPIRAAVAGADYQRPFPAVDIPQPLWLSRRWRQPGIRLSRRRYTSLSRYRANSIAPSESHFITLLKIGVGPKPNACHIPEDNHKTEIGPRR